MYYPESLDGKHLVTTRLLVRLNPTVDLTDNSDGVGRDIKPKALKVTSDRSGLLIPVKSEDDKEEKLIGSMTDPKKYKGQCVFLLRNIDNGLNNLSNYIGKNINFGNNLFAIKYIYSPMRYRGYIGNLRYNLIDSGGCDSLYKWVKNRSGELFSLRPYPYKYLNNVNNYSIYYDLGKYNEVFHTTAKKKMLSQKVDLYWSFFNNIINDSNLKQFKRKMVLIRAEDWCNNFSSSIGSINAYMKNPLTMLYYSLYKRFDLVKAYNIDFYIAGGRDWVLYLNPSKCQKDSYKIFLIQLKRLFTKLPNATPEINEEELNSTIAKTENRDAIVSQISQNLTNNFNGKIATVDNTTVDENKVPTMKGFANKVEADKVDEDLDEIGSLLDSIAKKGEEDEESSKDEDDTKSSSSDNSDEVGNNKRVRLATVEEEDEAKTKAKEEAQLINSLYSKMTSTKNVTRQMTPREKVLQEKQKTVKFGNMTLQDLEKIDTKSLKIDDNDISNVVRTPNKSMTDVKFANFDKDYAKKLMPKDLAAAITSLSTKSLPLYVKNIEIKDTSDELNYKDTYTITMEDANHKQQTIKVDIPKILDGRYLFIGGNKKIIQKQNFLYPIVKTGPDEVQIVTNCNKMFMRRTEGRTLVTVDRLLRMIKANPDIREKYFKVGNAFMDNKDIVTTVEYDELATIYRRFETPDHKTVIYFSQPELNAATGNKNNDVDPKHMLIGFEDMRPIYINTTETQRDEAGRSIVDIIYNAFNDEEKKMYNRSKAPKRQMFAKVRTMEQDVPVVVLLSYWVGLSEVLKRAKIKYELSDKPPAVMDASKGFIQFSDCYLIYNITTPAMLLLSGFASIDTKNYKISAFDTDEPYLQYFKEVYGRVIIANSLMNAYEWTIDPITEEVLDNLNLPTNIVDLMLYGIELLSDNHAIPEIEQDQSRVRCLEVIPAILYYNLSRSYTNYKNSGGRKKFSIKPDCVIKDVLGMKTVEDVSVLNPFLEVERSHNISSMGWRGVNVDRAYTMSRRSYPKSMVGIIAPSSSPDANVGLTRCLSLEPEITSLRGYCQTPKDKKDLDKLNESNLFSPTELLIPFGVTRDDSTRIGHMVKQSKHALPTVKSSPVLISNGSEETVRFHLSSDFAVNAEQDGKVVEKDPNSGIMILEYKDGSHQAVNLKPKIVKNGGGGFFMSNQLETNYNVGDKFKKNDSIAWHKEFFRKDFDGTTRMTVGSLQKIAVMAEYGTHEDATFITKKMSKDMGSEMTFCMSVVVGKNSNIDFIAHEGDHIEVGDTIIQFDTSYDESELNKLLANLAKDPRLMEAVMEDSRNNIKSKYAGKIEAVKVYATVDTDEMSDSLSKAVKEIYAKTKKKLAILNKYDKESSIVKCGMLVDEPTGKLSPNKFGVLAGEKVDDDSILFKFYISHVEPLEVGSKIANHTALKNTICEIIPEGFEPWSSFRPEEEVSTIISCNSILNRMVPSILLSALGNKCQIELKRKLRDIYFS